MALLPDLTTLDRAIIMLIVGDDHSRLGRSFISRSRIAEVLRCDLSSVTRAVSRLEAADILSVTRRPGRRWALHITPGQVIRNAEVVALLQRGGCTAATNRGGAPATT